MIRNFGFVAPALFTLGLVAYACTSGEVVTGPATGSAGSNPQGQAGTNGQGQAGTLGQGQGGTSQAGTNGRGGTVGSAGTGQAGTFGRGGTVGSAGTNGRGGTGQAGTFGQAGTDGSGTAGTMGTSTCPPTFSVGSNGFVQMPVAGGCWSGYPYTYADSFGTMVMPAPMASWTTNTLKLTGNLVAVSGSNYSYAGIGFSIGQTGSGSPTLVTPTGNGLTFNVTNSTTGTGVIVRAQVTDGTMTWCHDMTTFPATLTWSQFTVNCYMAGGAAYAKQPIKGLEVNLAGGTGAGTINVTINSITEN